MDFSTLLLVTQQEAMPAQGRLLALRVRGLKSDIMHVFAYFPTPSTPNARHIVHHMIKWLQMLFNNMSMRCIPIMYMDCNSGFGK
eukprot:1658165-Karenia_brevis.AAC.1